MKILTAIIFLLTSLSASAQTAYSPMSWGMNKGVTPYQFGANINGAWSNLGTVSSTGVWQIPTTNISGLGTAASQNIGTSGATVPLLNGTNTWSATQTFGTGTFTSLSVKGAAIVSIFNYATCNGSADDSAGFLSASASNKRILIPANASCKISTDTVIPRGSAWIVEKGGTINVTTGVTLRMRSELLAGRYQIFNGVGAVISIAQAKPEWWGANGNFGNTFDSHDAFQAAVNSASTAFESSAPGNFSDAEGTPAVDIGQGFFNLCSPVDLYPTSGKPIVIRGIGPFGSGSKIQACSTFTGYAPFLVHGYAFASGNLYYASFKDISIDNPVRASGATAAIRYVPEGTGYNLNATQKASMVDNVAIIDFPIGIDIVNTHQLIIRRSSYKVRSTSTSNNIGFRLYASGAITSGNSVDQITFDSVLIDACDAGNAITCTNTTGVELNSSSGGQINAIVFNSAIFYSSNTGLKMVTSGTNSAIGDIWVTGNGNQFDGQGCNYIDASASSSAYLFNVHIDHVYHTGTYANTCVAHKWYNDGSSTLFKIWDTNNEFILGGTSTAILSTSVKDMVISGNVFEGTSPASTIVANQSTGLAITGNVISGTWASGISLGSGTTNTNVVGNECNGATLSSGCIVDATSRATTTNDVNANSDRTFGPAILTLKSYTISGLPTCNAAWLGTIAVASNGTDYATGTYGSAVGPATGSVTRKVLCTNTGGATTYAWAYN